MKDERKIFWEQDNIIEEFQLKSPSAYITRCLDKLISNYPNLTVLDIGCGGGVNVERFAGQISNEGKVIGLDYSDVSVEKSSKRNEEFINEYKGNVKENAYKEGYDEGFDDGCWAEKVIISRRLLNKDFDYGFIGDITNLSIEEVKRIESELN